MMEIETGRGPRIRIHWGAAIAAVYVMFAGATLAFVVFAIGRPVELVRADYYEQSLAHDAHMQAIANADALGDAVRVAAVEGESAFEVIIPAAMAPGGSNSMANSSLAQAARAATMPAPAPGDKAAVAGTVTLYRPSDRAADRVVALAPDAAGRQRIAVDGAPRGRWVIKLAWNSGGRDFYREQAVLLP